MARRIPLLLIFIHCCGAVRQHVILKGKVHDSSPSIRVAAAAVLHTNYIHVGRSEASSESQLADVGMQDATFLVVAALLNVFAWGFWVVHSMASHGQKELPLSRMGQHFLRAVMIGTIIMAGASESYFIPLSYDIAVAIKGCGSAHDGAAFLSGLLQGSQSAGAFLGVFVAYWIDKLDNYDLNRKCMLLGSLSTAGLYTALACILHAPSFHDYLGPLIFALRSMSGFGVGMVGLLCGLARKITPDSEQVALSILEYTAVAGGLAVGPVISAVGGAASSIGQCGQFSQAVHATCIIAGGHAICSILVHLCVPCSENSVTVHTNKDDDTVLEDEQTGGPRLKILVGLIGIFLGVFSCVGVEVSSALIFELQYGWSATKIGYMMGVVFCCGVVLLLLFFGLERWLSTFPLLIIASLCTLIGLSLIFDRGTGGAWQLLVADALAYPSLTGLTSIIHGMFFQGSAPGMSTMFLITVIMLALAFARSVAPPVVRAVIEGGGRNMYAGLQVVVAVLAICIAMWMRGILEEELTESNRATAIGRKVEEYTDSTQPDTDDGETDHD